MHKSSIGHVVYETFSELLDAPIEFITELDGFYFVSLKPDEFFDNTIWRVDKKTGKVKYIPFTEYIIEYMDDARPVDPNRFKKRGA